MHIQCATQCSVHRERASVDVGGAGEGSAVAGHSECPATVLVDAATAAELIGETRIAALLHHQRSGCSDIDCATAEVARVACQGARRDDRSTAVAVDAT
ncbi:hypothetical protein D3C81_1080230 [compost metagenome]